MEKNADGHLANRPGHVRHQGRSEKRNRSFPLRVLHYKKAVRLAYLNRELHNLQTSHSPLPKQLQNPYIPPPNHNIHRTPPPTPPRHQLPQNLLNLTLHLVRIFSARSAR